MCRFMNTIGDSRLWGQTRQLLAGHKGEADEALEARVEGTQQLRLLVECEHARPRLVLPALDAAERVADVVAFVDCALEDRLG